MIGLHKSEVSPGWGQVVLEVFATLVTRGCEQVVVCMEPQLCGTHRAQDSGQWGNKIEEMLLVNNRNTCISTLNIVKQLTTVWFVGQTTSIVKVYM